MSRTFAFAIAGSLLFASAVSADVPPPPNAKTMARVSFQGIEEHPDYVFYLLRPGGGGGPRTFPPTLTAVKDSKPFNLNGGRNGLGGMKQGLRIKGCQVERENNHDGHGVHLSACQARPKMADRENLLPMLEDGQYVGVTARRDSWTKMQLHPAHSSQAHGPGRHLTRPHSMPAKCQETTEHFLQPEEHTLRRVILNA